MDYRVFLSDLPKRAWENYERSVGSRVAPYEVSALLCACWAVFVVPSERLDLLADDSAKSAAKSSASRDRESNSALISCLVREWKQLKNQQLSKFLGLSLAENEGLFTPGERVEPSTGRGKNRPGSTGWIDAVRAGHHREADPNLESVVRCIRHGLSHANIWTDPPNDESVPSRIQRIVIANFLPGYLPPVAVLIFSHQTLEQLARCFKTWLAHQEPDQLFAIGDMSVSGTEEAAA